MDAQDIALIVVGVVTFYVLLDLFFGISSRLWTGFLWLFPNTSSHSDYNPDASSHDDYKD